MELIESAIQWPNIVPSVLIVLVTVYWLLVIAGALDIELFDLDFDTDVDGDLDGDMAGAGEGATGLGFVVLKFLNIGQVPSMIWGSIFTVSFWLISMLLWKYWDDGMDQTMGYLAGSLQLVRNLVVSAVVAKLATNPMRTWFANHGGPKPREVVGMHCELTTNLNPESKGQARLVTHAAPRLLNVRCKTGEFQKGDTVVVTEYAAETKTYWVGKHKDEV